MSDETTPPAPRRRGRPPGAKNRPKDSIITSEKLEALYHRFSPYLDDEQKAYIQGVIRGHTKVDVMLEMQLLVRSMSLLFQEATTYYFGQAKVTQDLGKFADSLRMAIKDLHEMQEKQEEKAAAKQEEDGLVQLSRERPAVARLAEVLGRYTD